MARKRKPEVVSLVDQVLAILDAAAVPELISDHITNILDLYEQGKICCECGCTEDDACMTDDGPCYWAEPGLCSACVDSADETISREMNG